MVLYHCVLYLLVLDTYVIRHLIFFGRYNRRYDIKRPFRTCPYRRNYQNFEGNDTISFNFTVPDITFTDGDFFHYWIYVLDYQHCRHAVHDLSFHVVDVNGTLTVQYNLYVPERKPTIPTLKMKTTSTTEEPTYTTESEPDSDFNVFED